MAVVQSELIAQFDPAQGQMPESIARDHDGTVILSMAGAHTISRIVPDGRHTAEPIATLPVAAGAFSVGVKVRRNRDIFACSAAFNPQLDASHVWKLSPSGEVTDIAHLDAAGFPNDIAFDDKGNLYVTDSTLGQIYKIDKDRHITQWLRDPCLLGNSEHPLLGSAFGANGIVFDRDRRFLYVDNTDFGAVYRIPMHADGSPGPIELFVSDGRLAGADGIAFDTRGNLYVAVNAQNQIARIDGDRVVTLVAQGGPLDCPSSVAFATDGDEATKLFISSFAIAEAIGVTPGVPRPSLSSIQVPCGGLPPL